MVRRHAAVHHVQKCWLQRRQAGLTIESTARPDATTWHQRFARYHPVKVITSYRVAIAQAFRRLSSGVMARYARYDVTSRVRRITNCHILPARVCSLERGYVARR